MKTCKDILTIAILLSMTLMLMDGGTDAFAERMPFRHITSSEGLKYTWISHITRDSEGYMWFSSLYGAHRYDGYSFEDFSFIPQGSRVASRVTAVSENDDKTLWFSTENGLYSMDIHTREHTPFLQGVYVGGVDCSASGTVWAATPRGVFAKQAAGKDFSPVPDSRDRVLPPFSAIEADTRQHVWAGTSDGRLFRTDDRSMVLHEVQLPYPVGAGINSLFEDSGHNIWLCTSGAGAYRYNPQSGNLTAYSTADGKLRNNLARSAAEDASGTVWISTENGLAGQRPDDSVEFVTGNVSSIWSLNDNATYGLYCDEDNNLWVGCFFGGVNVHFSDTRLFSSTLSSPAEYSIESKVVSDVIECGDNLFVATENDGIYVLDADGAVTRHFHSGNTDLTSDNIHSLCLDRKGNLWVGSYGGGLYRGRPFSGQFRNYRETAGRDGSLSVDDIYCVREDSRGNIWVGTQNGGLYRYDESEDRVEHFPESLPGNLFVWDILEDSSGDILVAVYGNGIYRLCPDKDYEPEHIASPASRYISLCELSNGMILAGTEKEGLVCYDQSESACVQIMTEDGLPDDTVYAILQDDDDNVWLSTNNGLCRVSDNLKSFSPFTVRDGLPTNRFNYNASLKAGGKLYFGSTNGLVEVRTRREASVGREHSIRFTAMTFGSERIPVCSDRVQLDFSRNTFGIEFSTDTYDNIGLNFAYRIAGLDYNWHRIGQNNRVNLIGLRPGKYCLEVATVENGIITENISSLGIRIKPLFWQSPWTRLGIALILAGFVIYLIYVLFQASSHRHALEMEKLEREKDNEINETKLRFFVNISHEFKTPLSLILGPVEQFLAHNVKQPQQENYFRIIKKNADKLLALINELLAFREVQLASLKISGFNVCKLIETVVSRYDWFIESKKIGMEVSCDRMLEIEADYDKVEKILANLISNACKHTGRGGTIKISASGEEDGYVCFCVRDSGEGIDAEKLPHIFERFFTGESYDNYSSGVGLSYVKSLVELHGGTITAESSPGEGANFIFRLPCTQAPGGRTQPDTGQDYASLPILTTGNEDAAFDEGEYAALARDTFLLIVEDDATMRELLSDFFSGRYRLHIASSCEEALRMLHHGRYDVIVSDVILGSGMSGFDLCKNVKNDPDTSHIKVLLMTVLSEQNYQMEGLNCGADAYLVKPFSFRILEQMIRNLLVGTYKLKEALKIDVGVDSAEIPDNDQDSLLIRKVGDYLFSNISNPAVDMDALCRHVGMSKSSLYRKMKTLTGMSAGEFVQNLRIKYAARLLVETDRTVAEIAYEAGFEDPYYFSRAFKKITGCSPSRWRMRNRHDYSQ